MKSKKNRVCPVELSGSLDNKLRKLVHNPQRILLPHLKEGMTVADIGCGPGFFTVEMAKLIGESGKVFAVDLQEGMLQKIKDKITGTELEKRIILVKCDEDKINVPEPVDFILAFYMIHEVPNKDNFFEDIKLILKKSGSLMIVEPKLFHVSQKEYDMTIKSAQNAGFIVSKNLKVLFSRSSILVLK